MSQIQKIIWESMIPIHITLSPSLHTSAPAPALIPPSPSPIPPSISRFSPKPSSPSPRGSPTPSVPEPSASTLIEAPLPYILNIPRLSYLPLLLPKLNAFYEKQLPQGKSLSSFSYEGIELRALPAGLLCDLYSPELGEGRAWKLEVRDGWGGGMSTMKAVEDGWVNSVKEADFLRNGTAKAIMSLSRESSTALWHAVLDQDLSTYNAIHTRLLNQSNPLRHIPLRIYLPQPEQSASSQVQEGKEKGQAQPAAGSFKVVQGLVTPRIQSVGSGAGEGRLGRGAASEMTTVGMALNQLLPSLFPSRRDAILAEVILHGVTLPMRAVLEEVMREASYSDGWLHLVVVMLN